MSQLKGGGGAPKTPPTPTNTPDNLRSEDTVEMVLGITEGPWKGPTNGRKSMQVGDTVLDRQDGETNFEDVELNVYPGNAFPEVLNFKLGGESSNTSVNVSLAYGVPVTRQTEHGNIDAIDVRLVVQQLYKSVEQGKNPGVFDNTFQFKIRYKPLSAPDWSDWYETGAQDPSTGNPYVTEYDTWGPDTYYDGAGTWYDPNPESPKVWSSGNFSQSIIWWIAYKQAQPGGWTPPDGLYINGKTTSTYVKEYRIPVQRLPEPYLIQVQRMSPDSSLTGDPKYIAEVSWESFQTIDKSPKKYPYTGFIQFVGRSTDQFTSVPTISGEGDGLIVKVPTNFNPETREYTGVWDGLFKEEWTNSPVWLLYEAIHNDRWGWSAYTPVSWSKYDAYALAQITDHILPSGKPRYTFNAYLTEPMDGREFCRYLAGSFNSVIVDDDNGHVQVLMDKDDPAVAIFGPESIVGDFEYTFTDINTRFNDLTVVFRNPDIDYNEDRRGVTNPDHIAQHGRIPFDFIAVGTTDQNEAVRKATRRLVSATTETEMVNFKTNRKAQYLSPYDIILITDPYKGYGLAGRFKSFTGTTITLRDPVYLETGVSYGLEIQSSTGILSRTITGVTTGWTSTLTVNSSLPSTVDQKAQFSLTQNGSGYGLPKPYRILEITMNENPDDWSIMAIEVNRLKFAAEDDATIVGEPRYTFPISAEPASPTNVLITNTSRPAPDGTILYEARVDFTPPSDAYVNRYFIRYRQVGETEYDVRETDGSGLTVSLPRDGAWEFQVQSRNIWNQQSLWIAPAVPVTTIDKNTAIAGGGISSITGGLNQITIKVTYPEQTDIRYARIYEASTNNNVSAVFVGRTDSDTFVRTGLVGVQTKYYWVKFEDNLENIGPFTASGGISATTTQITAPDIGAGVITLEKFANGVTAVEIVATLPSSGNFVGRTVTLTTDGKLYTWNGTAWVRVAPDPVGVGVETVSVLPSTGNFEGRIVYLSTDDKLYRYTGSAWTSAVPTTDLTGTITGPQIAPGAITIDRLATGLTAVEIVSTLPSSGNYTGRTVVLTTDGKLYRYVGGVWSATIPTTDLTGTITAAQIAANTITSAQIAANTITAAQIAVGGIVASSIAAGAITATKLAVMDTANAVIDPTFNDPAYWNLNQQSPPWTINSSDTSALIALASPRVLKSGTPSGTTHAAKYDQAYMTTPVPFEAGGKPARVSISYQVTAGFTGMLRAYIYQYNYAGTYVGAILVGVSNDYRTVAASTDTVGTITAIVDLDSTTGALALGVELQRSPTLNNAGYMYLASPRISRAVNAELIVDGTITGSKIAADTITATQIAANAITTSELAAGSVTATKIVAGTITAANIASGTITAAQIQSGSITGDRLTANTITAAQIAAASITTTQIAANTIVAANIAAGTITGDKISAATITATNIAAGTITAVEIATNAITSDKILAGAITATKIATGAITADMIGAGTITVSVNVGSSGKILLDGANNRIIISD